MKVFLAQWNPCIYESAFETLSIHKTREGADAAIAEKVAEVSQLRKGAGLANWEVVQVVEQEVLQ